MAHFKHGLWPLGPLKSRVQNYSSIIFSPDNPGQARLFIDASLLRKKLECVMDFLSYHEEMAGINDNKK